MEREMVEAIQLIASLKDGDPVLVTQDGRTNLMFVSGESRRCDGAYGPAESTRVTVTFGPGRYATEVAAENLVRTRRGQGWIGGGTELVKVGETDCLLDTTVYPEHDYAGDGVCRRCGAEDDE